MFASQAGATNSPPDRDEHKLMLYSSGVGLACSTRHHATEHTSIPQELSQGLSALYGWIGRASVFNSIFRMPPLLRGRGVEEDMSSQVDPTHSSGPPAAPDREYVIDHDGLAA